jgi:Domain of unknown function (DUF4258)
MVRCGSPDNVIPLQDRPLTPLRALERIKILWRDGNFSWCPHAEQRMIERGLDITDVENVIRYGQVVENSRPGPTTPWRYVVEGSDIEGKRAGVVLELEGDLLLLVSVMERGIRRGRR